MKNKKKKINTGVLIGVIAIIINIITVSVYVYQTNIMQKQQHASVWPYLEWRVIYNQENGFLLRVSNNGVGPALIKNSSMKLDGKEIDLNTLFKTLLDTTRFPHLSSEIENRVLPPSEAINLITIKADRWAEIFYYKLIKSSFEMEICYESIFKEQWICKGTEVMQGACK